MLPGEEAACPCFLIIHVFRFVESPTGSSRGAIMCGQATLRDGIDCTTADDVLATPTPGACCLIPSKELTDATPAGICRRLKTGGDPLGLHRRRLVGQSSPPLRPPPNWSVWGIRHEGKS